MLVACFYFPVNFLPCLLQHLSNCTAKTLPELLSSHFGFHSSMIDNLHLMAKFIDCHSLISKHPALKPLDIILQLSPMLSAQKQRIIIIKWGKYCIIRILHVKVGQFCYVEVYSHRTSWTTNFNIAAFFSCFLCVYHCKFTDFWLW